MSLVEVMIAFAVMTVVLLAILGAILQAYRMNEDARRRDPVRALLQSFADDFTCERVRINGNTVDETETVGTPDQRKDDKSSVGRELVGEFPATYRVLNRTRTITLYVVRADT